MRKVLPTPTISMMQAWLARLERSQHIFLIGLVVAFAVEILVDWNATFYEIKVLRAAQREKASHFAAVLRLAAEEPVASRDQGRLSTLAQRVLEDEDVAYVRFTDATGAVLAEEGAPLGARFPHQLDRDVHNLLADPEDLRRKIAASRHRDLFQAITDTEDRLIAAIVPGGVAPPKISPSERALAYQDRLYDEATREEDRSVTWALGVIDGVSAATSAAASPNTKAAGGEAENGPPRGVTLVALRTDRLQAATQKKLLKGTAITLFFLGVIFVQQISARRAKLRFLSLRDALAAARTALKAALPEAPPRLAGLDGALAFEQAERLGGTVYDFAKVPGPPHSLDIFVALPEGSGVDVALASVYVRDEQRRLREEIGGGDPEALFAALARAYARAPIHRRLCLLFFCVDLEAGELRGASCGGGLPVVLDSNSAEVPLVTAAFSLPEETGTDTDADTDAGADTGADTDTGAATSAKTSITPDPTALLEAPLLTFRAPFAEGSSILFYNDGLSESAKHPIELAEVRARAIAWATGPVSAARTLVDDLRSLTLKRAPEPSDDLFILALRRK